MTIKTPTQLREWAQEVVQDWIDEEEATTEDGARELIHVTAAGSEYVIYPSKARKLLTFLPVEYEREAWQGLKDTGVTLADFPDLSDLYSRLAFHVLENALHDAVNEADFPEEE